MADRLNLFNEPDLRDGIPSLNEMEDFPIISPPDASGGFNVTGSYKDFFTPEKISQEQYRTGFVDFVNQTLESTGVGVDREKTIVEDIDRTGNVGITRDGDSGDDEPNRHSSLMGQSDIRISTDGGTGDSTGTTIYDMNSVQFKSAEDYKQYTKELKQDRSGLFSKEKIGAASSSLLTAAFGANPIVGAVMSGLTFGDTVKSPTGNTAFRPAGALGYVTDLLHSQQSKALTEIQAAHAAGLDQKGFVLDVGGRTLVRKPGKFGYIGNLDGFSLEYLHAQEAYSKGLTPDTYDPRNETGQSFEETGGVISGTHSHYKADGTFYNAKTGTTSRQGNLSDLNMLAEATGLSGGLKGDASKALEMARSGEMTLADAIRSLGGDPYKIKTLEDAANAGLVTSGFGVTIRGGEIKGGSTKPKAGTGSEVVKGARNEYAEFLVQRQKEKEAAAAEKARQDKIIAEQRRQQQQQTGSPGQNSDGPTYNTVTGPESFEDYHGRDYHDYAAGGTVGMAAGGAMAAGMGSGFVDRPPSQVPEGQTVADDVETKMPEGAFVINAAAVEFAGEQDIKKMLNDAQKEAVRRGITIDNSGNSAKLIDVAISRGEVTVAPYLAKIIGYDRLNKINNRGKPETTERLQEAAQGGMLGMAEGGVASPTRRPKREQLADIELRADLETFIQGDALARLGYKLYEQGDVRFNTVVAPREYGVRPRFKGAYFPPGNVRTDKRGVIPIRDIDDMRTGRVMEAQGIAPSQLESDAGRVLLVGSMFDTPETTVDMITIAHEFRHAALDYLSKTYDLGLPTLKQEERIMDYADNQAIEKAGKVNPKLKERYFSNPDYKLMSERGKSAGDSAYLRKQYEQYTGLAEDILKAMDVPPQSPAIEKEGFLTRTYKSLAN